MRHAPSTATRPLPGHTTLLVPVAGDEVLGALFDEFVWVTTEDEAAAPPRVGRNQLVHGHTPLDGVPAAAVAGVLRLVLGLSGVLADGRAPPGESVLSAVAALRAYRPRLHPLCRLDTELHRVLAAGADGGGAEAALLALGATRDALLAEVGGATTLSEDEPALQARLRGLADALRASLGLGGGGAGEAARPSRCWCDCQELGKVAVLRKAAARAARLVRCALEKHAALAGKVAADLAAKRAKSCADHARTLSALCLATAAAELLALIALERARAAEASLVLPSHLDACGGSLEGFAERGCWKKVLPVVAALVGGVAGQFPLLLGRLSARERDVYALDVEAYMAAVAAGAVELPPAISRNPICANFEKAEQAAGADQISNGRWRLQREKKQRPQRS